MALLLEAAIVPLVIVLALAGSTYAQFTSGVNLVEVYATVTDQRGAPVRDLTAADVRIREDGSPQMISAFAAGDFPLAVAIGLDRSFSMAAGRGSRRLDTAKSAARAFIDALKPADQVMVIAIGSETSVVAPLSTKHEAALAAIDRLDAWGTTPLYDAMASALDAIQSAKGRRALVVLSDGSDRYSDTSAAVLVDRVRRRDVLVYPVAIGSERPAVFAELATASGGRSFYQTDPRELSATLTSIANELRSQYLLGYTPARPVAAEPSWHSIEVVVNRPGVRVRARDGYYSK
jgi:Ca-activated chloride channel family protein